VSNFYKLSHGEEDRYINLLYVTSLRQYYTRETSDMGTWPDGSVRDGTTYTRAHTIRLSGGDQWEIDEFDYLKIKSLLSLP